MPADQEGGPPEPPDYKLYRARRGPRLGKPDLASLREKARGSKAPKQPRAPKQPKRSSPKPDREGRHWVRWLGFALLGWLLLSLLSFGVSAQLQKSKLADVSGLGGNPLLVAFPQNILVLGTDVRSEGFGSDADESSKDCIKRAQTGAATANVCPQPSRADSIMVLRAGGGSFDKLSIPRDTIAAIPGQDTQKINAAYAFGGADLMKQTVEDFLGIEIDHVAIVDFDGFRDFIDAIGGVEVRLGRRICNSISDGAFRIHLHKGTNTLDGDAALTLARTRETTCGPAITDVDRAGFQQLILGGIKGRLTDPLRIPRNFIFGPIIGWNAPKAIVSDLGALSMPQLVLAAIIGGGGNSSVLVGPGGSGTVPRDRCIKAVVKLTGSKPGRDPACSPA